MNRISKNYSCECSFVKKNRQ